MRIQHIITKSAVIIAAIFIAGCSKSSSPPSHAATQSNTQDYIQDARKAFAESGLLTNTLDVLQARYQEDEKQIEEVQTELDLLRKKYKITDTSPTQLEETNQSGNVVVSSEQPYWDEKRKLTGMIEFHKQLQVKIEADKLDEQIPHNVAN
jgi:hypothetical protein